MKQYLAPKAELLLLSMDVLMASNEGTVVGDSENVLPGDPILDLTVNGLDQI